MKKTNEIIERFIDECNKPFNIVFSIEIPKSDFIEMIREIESLQEELVYYKKMKDRYQQRLIEKGEKIFEPDFLTDF